MNIKLKKFGSALISRQAGKEAFAAFQTSLNEISDQESVLVDFEDVITFSSAWGDEFLTPLSQRFGEHFKLMHTQNLSVKASLDILEQFNKIKFNIVE